MAAEPEECLEDIAMAQWEEAVITVRGTVKSEGSTSVKTHPNQQLAHEALLLCIAGRAQSRSPCQDRTDSAKSQLPPI